jgi:steroid 5-alpha reductase family enzyme
LTFAGLVTGAVTAEILLAIVMTGAWAVQRATGVSGWIDAIWTLGAGAAGAVLSLSLGAASGAPSWRFGLAAALAVAWSLRLGLHIVYRTMGSGDDPRYRKLMQDWGEAAPRKLFAFLQTQAVAGAVLALAVGLAGSAVEAAPRLQDWLGAGLVIVAILGEAAADAEIARFKANAANRGKICDVGLWSLSRHPNYVCETLVWAGFAIMALGAHATGWVALAAPALMYWTLRYVSGVPPLEEHMLASRPEAFRAYQARTPIFFPRLWPRERG